MSAKPTDERHARLLKLGVHVDGDGDRSAHVRSDDFDWLLHKLSLCPPDDFEQSYIAKIIRHCYTSHRKHYGLYGSRVGAS